MLNPPTTRSFSNQLVQWFQEHKRDLPWRNTTNPYNIWLSEIILQQTRVNQGLSYYERFIETFPTVNLLAQADENEVLKLWQGLGYYSRARNLHATAKTIVCDYKGVFPSTHKDILALKGIGAYTAAAISSFAFNLPYAVVDGNVYRVLSRLYGIDTPIDSGSGQKAFANLAHQLLNKNNPGLHNQAMMEFGALQCTVGQPDCSLCPFNSSCVAYNQSLIHLLPVKKQKTKQRDRFFNYLCILFESSTYLQQRTGKDIWQNLYEFPLIETTKAISFEELIKTKDYITLFSEIDTIEIVTQEFTTKHLLSHQKIHAVFYTLRINSINKYITKYVKTSFNNLYNLPISRLTEIFIESVKIISD